MSPPTDRQIVEYIEREADGSRPQAPAARAQLLLALSIMRLVETIKTAHAPTEPAP